MQPATETLVREAYDALASGDRSRIEQYWAADMTWLAPGHNQLSGLKQGLDGFLAFMQRVGDLSANSFHMTLITVITTGEYSADLNHNVGSRAGDPAKTLSIDVIHFLRWRDGKVIEGRGAIFGDGTAQYDAFWS